MYAVLNLATATVRTCRPKERETFALAQMPFTALFLHGEMRNVSFAHSIGLCLTDRVRSAHVRWIVIFLFGSSRGVLKRGIDLFTSPSNIEPVQLELEPMGKILESIAPK